MEYRVLASEKDSRSFIVTNQENLHSSLATVQQTHPNDVFSLLEDGPAASLLESIGATAMVDAFVETAGFYIHVPDCSIVQPI